MAPRQRSEELDKRIKKLRSDARKRLAKDGTVQFRLDAEMMSLLLTVADHKRTPTGVLARMWVVERLREEASRAGFSDTPPAVS